MQPIATIVIPVFVCWFWCWFWYAFVVQCHRNLSHENGTSLSQLSTDVSSSVTILFKYSLPSSWYCCRKIYAAPMCLVFVFGCKILRYSPYAQFSEDLVVRDYFMYRRIDDFFPQRYNEENKKYLSRIVMGDETWINNNNKLASFPNGLHSQSGFYEFCNPGIQKFDPRYDNHYNSDDSNAEK